MQYKEGWRCISSRCNEAQEHNCQWLNYRLQAKWGGRGGEARGGGSGEGYRTEIRGKGSVKGGRKRKGGAGRVLGRIGEGWGAEFGRGNGA